MQNPEVWSFQEPQSSLQVKELNSSADLSPKNLRSFYFNHLVSIVIPDSLKTPEGLVEVLSNDCEYYKILDLNLSDLLNTDFLNNFIRQGTLTLLSIGTRIDCDNCVAITPTGLLILSLNKDTYQTLGIEGKVSHYTKRNKDRYIVSIDLKEPKLQPEKANYEKTKRALASLERFTVIVSWTPHEESICPSSVAKFFNDLEYNVRLCEPAFKTHVRYTLKTPTLGENKLDENDITDFVEWLGMIGVEADLTGHIENYVDSYEPPEPNVILGQVRFLQWRGFYQPSQICRLIEFVRKYSGNDNEDKLWVAVYVQGFSDAPVTEGNQEHHHFTSGDTANVYIFNKSRLFCCAQRCSAKRYK